MPLPVDLRLGAVHLAVADVERTLALYRDALGFELVARLPDTAFVSVGGYHDHVAFNVWDDPGPAPAAGPRRGLRHWTMRLRPSAVDDLAARLAEAGFPVERRACGALRTSDPWGTAVVATPEGSPR